VQLLPLPAELPGADKVQYPGEYEAMNRQRNSEFIELGDKIGSSLEALAGSLDVSVPTCD